MNEEQREVKLQFLIDNVEEKDMFQMQFQALYNDLPDSKKILKMNMIKA